MYKFHSAFHPLFSFFQNSQFNFFPSLLILFFFPLPFIFQFSSYCRRLTAKSLSFFILQSPIQLSSQSHFDCFSPLKDHSPRRPSKWGSIEKPVLHPIASDLRWPERIRPFSAVPVLFPPNPRPLPMFSLPLLGLAFLAFLTPSSALAGL